MSFESLMAASQRLSVSVETLAARGAQLRLQQEGLDGDPRVRALLNEIVHAVDPQLLENVDSRQQAAALAHLDNLSPGARPVGESDPCSGVELPGPGHPSIAGTGARLIVRGIDAMAAQRPELSATLRRFSTPAPASVGWQLRPHVPGRYSGWSGLTLGNLL
jgi:hypothetical protein